MTIFAGWCFFSQEIFDTEIGALTCGIVHTLPDETHPIHSWVIIADRSCLFVFRKRYLSEFSLDEQGQILPIPDEILSSAD